MANAITAHTLVNGPRNLILQYNIVSDGVEGDYSAYKLLDVTDYTGEDVLQPDDFKVIKVEGRNGVGTSFQLHFGAPSGNRLFFESTTDDNFRQSWDGGMPTLLPDTDMTVRLTTNGFDASGDTISLLIHVQKKRANVGA